MPDLAELLALMHDARGRGSTLRATVAEWRHHERMAEVFGRGGKVIRYAFRDSAEPAPETSESVSRFWFAPPDRVREEHDDHRDGVAVARGERWWRYDSVGGAISHEVEPDMDGGVGEQLAWILEPARLLGALEFGEVAAGEQAGRPTLRARAVPRPPLRGGGPDTALFMLGASDADDVVLDVDAERGVLLRVECRIGGEPYLVREVREIAYDEELADSTFELEFPEGVHARAIEREFEHDVTLERAVALAPFAVWIAPRVPRDWAVDITFVKAMERPPTEPRVFIHYAAENGVQEYVISQTATDSVFVDELPGGAWERHEIDGRAMELREQVEDWHPAQVRLELGGTRLHLHSGSLSRGVLADVAAELVPAPDAP
ncbi:MAG: hypothetical protein ABW060_06535 [Solirubrobacteraceae bacterium]